MTFSNETKDKSEVAQDREWHWDPAPAEREYFREESSGQLGWKVIREGKEMVRLDRADEEIIRRLNHSWIPERESRPLTKAQVAQVAFEADKKLCFFMGQPEQARKDWNNMHEAEKRRWMTTGPATKVTARVSLYMFIQESLKDLIKQ